MYNLSNLKSLDFTWLYYVKHNSNQNGRLSPIRNIGLNLAPHLYIDINKKYGLDLGLNDVICISETH